MVHLLYISILPRNPSHSRHRRPGILLAPPGNDAPENYRLHIWPTVVHSGEKRLQSSMLTLLSLLPILQRQDDELDGRDELPAAC